jgi:hypothetical protein
MKFGVRTPSLKKRIAARTSWKRYVRHNLGVKAPRGWGWLTNPKRAAYNRVYNRTSISVDRLFSSKRRRRGGSGGDGLVVVAVIGIAVAVAAGIYFVIAAAVLVVGWLVRIGMKRPSDGPAPVETSPAGEPRMEYEPVADVDPSDFQDEERSRRAARIVFSAWARRMPSGPRHADDLVRGIELQQHHIASLDSAIEGRRFVERTAPCRAREMCAPVADVSTLDPWNPPADLRVRTRTIAPCSRCSGQGHVACPNCGASGRVACLACSGSGKYYGTTANGAHRMLNCKSCKGKGTVSCGSCMKGTAQCPSCEGATKIECWFDVEAWTRTDSRVHPPGESLADSPVIADLASAGPLLPSTIPPAVARDCLDALSFALEPGERVRSQRLVVVDRPSVKVSYVVRDVADSVTFVGPRLLAQVHAVEHAFASRARLLSRLRAGLLCLPFAVGATYVLRGTYFVTGRAAPFVAGITGATAGIALCLYAVAWYVTLRRKGARMCGSVALSLLAVVIGLALAAEPSVARARGYLAAGRLADADRELESLGSPQDPELADVWADLWLKQAIGSSSCTDAAAFAARIPAHQPQHSRAVARADDLALGDAKRKLDASDLAAASAALACASTTTREGASGRKLAAQISLTVGQGCLRAQDWDCVLAHSSDVEKLGAATDALALRTAGTTAIQALVDQDVTLARAERDVNQRAHVENAALALWSTYLRSSGAKDPAAIASLKAGISRDEAAIAHQQELERQKEAAAERRRLAEEKREQARQEAAERAREYSPLVCGDGTLSPSCVCGGSWRGCCSHHHGVSGCQGQ